MGREDEIIMKTMFIVAAVLIVGIGSYIIGTKNSDRKWRLVARNLDAATVSHEITDRVFLLSRVKTNYVDLREEWESEINIKLILFHRLFDGAIVDDITNRYPGILRGLKYRALVPVPLSDTEANAELATMLEQYGIRTNMISK